MSEYNSPVIGTREVMPEYNSTTRNGDADKLSRLGNALDYPDLCDNIRDGGVFVLNWDQLATVAGGTTTTLTWIALFPCILHGLATKNTAAVGATCDLKVGGSSVLDAPTAIAAGTLKVSKPEEGDQELDYGDIVTVELIAAAGNDIATPYAQLVLQRR